MPTYATSVQHENQILMGSAKVEASVNGGGAWVDIGLAKGVYMNEQIVFSKVQADNAPACKRRVSSHTVDVGFTLIELHLDTIDKLRGAELDTVTAVAAAEVLDAVQVVSSGNWLYNNFIEFTYQMGDGTCPSIDSVTGGTDNALTVVTDYDTVKNGAGKWGIIVKDSTAVTTETQTLTIQTDYTPAASNTFSTGGLTQIEDIDLKLTNTEYISTVEKTKYLWIYKAYLNSGLEMAFKSSVDEDQAMEVPFKFEGELDTGRTAGDQLFIYSDNAATT